MSVIKKISLKNAAGEDVLYDIGADSANVRYDDENTVAQKIAAVEDIAEGVASGISGLQTAVDSHTTVLNNLTSDLNDLEDTVNTQAETISGKLDSFKGSLANTVAGSIVFQENSSDITAEDAAAAIWGKFNALRAELGEHEAAAIYSEDGIHGMRYFGEQLQVWSEDEEDWITVSTGGGGGSDIDLGDVSGAACSVSGTTATLTWSDPEDVVISGATFARWAGTVVVRKIGSAPSDVNDGTVVATNTTRNQYASTGFEDTGLNYDTTYYYRFFPYKLSGGSRRYTAGSSVVATPGRTVIQNVPSPVSSIPYDGNSHTPTWNNYNSTELTMTGETVSSEVGGHAVTFTPKEGYCWNDGSTSGTTVYWYIVAASVTVPSVTNTALTYNRSSQGPTISSYDTEKIVASGATATNAGNYTLTLSLLDPSSYAWSDGTSTDKEFSWSISPKVVSVPSLSGTYTYTGSSQTVTISAYDTNEIDVSGETSATNAGSHIVYFDLTNTNNYKWSDNTAEQKNTTWNIDKAAGRVTLTYNSATMTEGQTISFDSSGATASITISNASGNISASSNATGVATTTLSGTTLKITSGSTSGNATITVNVAASTNYNAATFIFKVSVSLLALVSWANGTDAQIAAMLEAHYAGDIDVSTIWAVGDIRKVSLRSMEAIGVGESHAAQEVELVIIDFKHDDLASGGKAAVTVQQRDCLTNTGYMNALKTNSGGWDECARRAWCNNVYKKALPTTLASLIKTVTKKTCAGGGSGTLASTTIKTSNDNVFMVSEVEIFGQTTYSLAGEGMLYEYYKTSANRLKYKDINRDRITGWWFRSCYPGDINSFILIMANASTSAVAYADTTSNVSIAPAFCI